MILSANSNIKLGVVIPTYRHPVLLAEALQSLFAQATSFRFVVVVVIDGCPLQETIDVCTALTIDTDNVHLLRIRNSGPGGARNAGINFLTDLYPTLESIFFLDSDNRLQPKSLQICAEALACAPTNVGWIYSNVDSFGMEWSGNYGVPYTRLLHVIHSNFCDTGSLVSRSVFNAGIRFDEDRRSGYEDWDFWLQCVDKGFVGLPVNFGLRYRKRPESRNKESQRGESAIRRRMLERHTSISGVSNILRWEHSDHPRFTCVLGESNTVYVFTDPSMRTSSISINEYAERFWQHMRLPDHYDLSPYIVVADSLALKDLGEYGLLHNAFYLLMRASEQNVFAALLITYESKDYGVRTNVPVSPDRLKDAVALTIRSSVLKNMVADVATNKSISLEVLQFQSEVSAIEISLPAKPHPRPLNILPILVSVLQVLGNSPYKVSAPVQRWESRRPVLPSRDSYYREVCRFFEVEDLACRVRSEDQEVGFIIPIGAYGGAEKVVYCLAKALREEGMRTHLFVLGPPVQKHIDSFHDAFDSRHFLDVPYPIWGGGNTVNGQEFFGSDDPDLCKQTILGLLLDLDLLINCSSAPFNSLLGDLRQKGIRTATYLHVSDKNIFGRLVGHPRLTVAFEHCYDVFITCSDLLRHEIHSLGIPYSKIIPIRNTATFFLPDDHRASIERKRAESRASRKLNILYIGRFDRQKGVDRLIEIVRELQMRSTPVVVRVIGSALLETAERLESDLADLDVTVEAPIYGEDKLIAAYRWADMLILPSRWEGAPLVIPECQSVGCIPIATNVGAVCEMISDGKNGILITDTGEEDIVASFVSRIELLLADDELRKRIALTAITESRGESWQKNVAPFVEWVNRVPVVRQRAPVQGR